jgi:hypothetical protein
LNYGSPKRTNLGTNEKNKFQCNKCCSRPLVGAWVLHEQSHSTDINLDLRSHQLHAGLGHSCPAFRGLQELAHGRVVVGLHLALGHLPHGVLRRTEARFVLRKVVNFDVRLALFVRAVTGSVNSLILVLRPGPLLAHDRGSARGGFDTGAAPRAGNEHGKISKALRSAPVSSLTLQDSFSLHFLHLFRIGMPFPWCFPCVQWPECIWGLLVIFP